MTTIPKLSIIFVLIFVVILGLFSAKSVNAADCTSHTTKQCVSNIVYWYNSCGALESIYQNCNTTNQTCQNGQCAGQVSATTTTPAPTSNQTLSPSIISAPNNPSLSGVSALQNQNKSLIISIFGQKASLGTVSYGSDGKQNNSETLQWVKNINTTNNDKINFLLIIKNISETPADSVLVKTDNANNITHAGDLKINNTASDSNIVSEINLGTIGPKDSQIISFTGPVLSQGGQNTIRVIASINSGGVLYDSDYLTVNIAPADNVILATTSNAEKTSTSNGIINNFKKNWHIWIAICLVLIVVFIIIFKKLSSNL